MTLNEYLTTVTQTELAARIGCSQSLVSQWLSGITEITAERAKAIEIATGGAVTRHDLRPDIFDAPRKGRAA